MEDEGIKTLKDIIERLSLDNTKGGYSKLLDDKINPYSYEYKGKFISKPTDEIWLDKKEHVLRTEYWRITVTCVYCKKEIKVYYDKRRHDILVERLRGKLCPDCNQVSLHYE